MLELVKLDSVMSELIKLGLIELKSIELELVELESIELALVELESVSYTHLDVYKRQGHHALRQSADENRVNLMVQLKLHLGL